MFNSPRQLNSPTDRLAISQMLEQIRKSERTLTTFVSRMAQNKKFADERPNLHKFFVSLNNFRSVRGTLTDKQKQAVNREIDKYASYFMTLRVARPVQVSEPVEEPAIHPSSFEDAPIDEDQALDDERAGMITE